jgi:hypothetical protein
MPYNNLSDMIASRYWDNQLDQQAQMKKMVQERLFNQNNPAPMTEFEKNSLNQQQQQRDFQNNRQSKLDTQAEQDRQMNINAKLAEMSGKGMVRQVDANGNDLDQDQPSTTTTPTPAQAQPSVPVGPANPAIGNGAPGMAQTPSSTPAPAFSALFGQSNGSLTPTGASAAQNQTGALGQSSIGSTTPSQTGAGQTGKDSGPSQAEPASTRKPDITTPDGRHFRFTTPEEQTATTQKQAKLLAAAQHQQAISDWNDHLNSLQSNPAMSQFLKDHSDDINALTFQTVTGAKLPPHTLSNAFGNMLQAAKDRADAGDMDGAKSIMDTFTKAEAATHPNTSATPALTPAALDQAAHRFAISGIMPPAGMGAAGQAVRTAIQNRAAELHPNADIAGNAAYYAANKNSLTKLVGQYDATDQYERTAGDNVNLYLNQIKKAIDSGSPWVNQPLREINDKLLGNTDIPALNAARQVATTEIARVTSNPGLAGNLTDTARREVQAFNPASATPAQAYNVMKILKQDMDNRRLEGAQQLQHVAGRFGGGIDDVRNIVNEDQIPTPGTTGPDGNPIPSNTPVVTPKNSPPPATPPPMPPSLPFGHGAKLDPKTAKIFLDASGGDKDKARDLAKHFTWTF